VRFRARSGKHLKKRKRALSSRSAPLKLIRGRPNAGFGQVGSFPPRDRDLDVYGEPSERAGERVGGASEVEEINPLAGFLQLTSSRAASAAVEWSSIA
jgi:hypothetical protein